MGTVIVLSLLVFLLAMPVTLTYELFWKQTLSGKVSLDWAFGLVRTDVSPDPAISRPEKPEAAPKRAGRRGNSKKGKTNILAAIRQESFRRRIVRFLSDVWRGIHKKDVRLMVRMGLGDPADTGRLWAMLGPLSGMFADLPGISIAIEPDFLDTNLEVDSSGTLRIVPLQFLALALGLLVSPSIWRGVMLMQKSG